MDNLTEKQEFELLKGKKLRPQDLPKIRNMVRDVLSGKLSQREAAVQHRVTRYEVRKWIDILNDQVYLSDQQGVDDVLKMKIVKQVYSGLLTHQEEALKYKTSVSMIKVWIRSMPGLKMLKKVIDPTMIDEATRIEVVRKIQAAEITQARAAKLYGVTHFALLKTASINQFYFRIDIFKPCLLPPFIQQFKLLIRCHFLMLFF
jgi:hypothetical protein